MSRIICPPPSTSYQKGALTVQVERGVVERNMNLDQFVSETITQIQRGAQTAASSGAGVPLQVTMAKESSHPGAFASWNSQAIFMVEFDVAVTATESNTAGAKAGVSVISVGGAGGEISSKRENSTVSRIKFSVPIKY